MKESRRNVLTAQLRKFTCGAAALAVASAASAQTVTVGPGTTAINYQHNWNNAVGLSASGNVLPSVLLNTVINNGRIVTVDSDIDVVAGTIQISNNLPGVAESILNIDAGGSLTTGTLTIGGNGAQGTLNVTGGDLSTSSGVAVNVASSFNLSGGTFTNTGTGARDIFSPSVGGQVNITGGTLIAQGAGAGDGLRLGGENINISGGVVALTGGQVQINGSTTLSVIGSDASITLDSLNASNASIAATFDFIFDENGVSTINNNGFLLLQEASINVDLSEFAGDEGVFDLFTSANLAGLASLENVTFAGLGDRTASFIQDEASNTVSIELTTIPEPGTLALVLAGPGLALVRRRRRS